jgi:hypothetical protein
MIGQYAMRRLVAGQSSFSLILFIVGPLLLFPYSLSCGPTIKKEKEKEM